MICCAIFTDQNVANTLLFMCVCNQSFVAKLIVVNAMLSKSGMMDFNDNSLHEKRRIKSRSQMDRFLSEGLCIALCVEVKLYLN